MTGCDFRLTMVKGNRFQHWINNTFGHRAQLWIFTATSTHGFNHAVRITKYTSVGSDSVHFRFPLTNMREGLRLIEAFTDGKGSSFQAVVEVVDLDDMR